MSNQSEKINNRQIPLISTKPKNKSEKSPENMVQFVDGDIEGAVLKNRYLVCRQLDEGSFGQVYKCVDLQDKQRPLVIKVSSQYKIFYKEINAMKKMQKIMTKTVGQESEVPEIIHYGIIALKNNFSDIEQQPMECDNEDQQYQLMSYFIIPRFGQNLEDYFEIVKNKLSRKSAYGLGLRIIDIIEKIHAAGYTYNDLKLDNLLIGF